MTYDELKQKVRQIAENLERQGARFAQEAVVLREVERQLGETLKNQHSGYSELWKRQKLILTAWNDLFKDGDLAWGHNFDSPHWPFFHVAERDVKIDEMNAQTVGL